MRRPLLLLAAVLAANPAFAQIDLSGEWSNLTHEDVNHRQSVEIGDYGGLPLKILWAVLDLFTVVVLGSGLYLWLRRRGGPVETRVREVESGTALP